MYLCIYYSIYFFFPRALIQKFSNYVTLGIVNIVILGVPEMALSHIPRHVAGNTLK